MKLACKCFLCGEEGWEGEDLPATKSDHHHSMVVRPQESDLSKDTKFLKINCED